jgi:hypothetical protein
MERAAGVVSLKNVVVEIDDAEFEALELFLWQAQGACEVEHFGSFVERRSSNCP